MIFCEKALDLQSHQSVYEYVNYCNSDAPQQQRQQVPVANYYGSTSPKNKYALRHRVIEPRHTPGYNNYGFRPEMRELDDAYVIPRLHVDDSDVSLDLYSFDNVQRKGRVGDRYPIPFGLNIQIIRTAPSFLSSHTTYTTDLRVHPYTSISH
jgi:hypothetical protein